MFLYYFDCVDPMLPRHNSNIGRTNDVYATALMWVGHLFKFLLIILAFEIVEL